MMNSADTTTQGVAAHEMMPEDVRPVVRVSDLAKRFRRADGSNVFALDHVSFDLAPGEFMVLLGPSGCGKTTLLRSVAGLEEPDEGTIEVRGKTVFSAEDALFLPPERRNLSMIFQSYALWPHMTAFANVAYPLACRKVPKRDAAERVNLVLDLVGIPNLGKQYPSQMSGGQQQRVALARALVANDELVLFDEPLSNVDAKVREHLRAELLTMQAELGFAALYVTHDQIEAMELADRMAIMNAGKIVQLGTPQEVYDRPATPYVARFIGAINEVPGVVEGSDGEGRLTVATDLGVVCGVHNAELAAGDKVVVIFRPELLEMAIDEPAIGNRWRGRVTTAVYVGSHTEYVVDLGPMRMRVWRASRKLVAEGSEVWVSIHPGESLLLPAEG